jgi:hypothetical protein
MKIQTLFSVSVAANVVLLCALTYHLHHAFDVPEYTPPLIWCVFTNEPVTAEAYDAQLYSLQTLAGFNPDSVDPSR